MKVYEEVEKHVLMFGTSWRPAATLPSEKDLLLSFEQEAGLGPRAGFGGFLDLVENRNTVYRFSKR